MIRHIVMWKFREEEQQRRRQFLDGLAGLYGVIPEIRHMEVREDMAGGTNFDAVLVADFDSLETLKTYKEDPRHKAVAAICKEIRTARAAVDYEL